MRYVYHCKKCNREFEVVHSYTLCDKVKLHSDLSTPSHIGLGGLCDGEVYRVIQECAIVMKGTCTPKFFGRAGNKMKKVDSALKAMGIEDESPGWTKGDGKEQPSKQRRKKAKKIGTLSVD
jgi:predicted nucleic acid-binding Zn ribbon protein